MYLKFYSKCPKGHFSRQFLAAQLSIGSDFSDGNACFEIWTDADRREPPHLLPCSEWRLTTCVPGLGGFK